MGLTVQDWSTFRLFGIIDNIKTPVSEPVIGSTSFFKLVTRLWTTSLYSTICQRKLHHCIIIFMVEEGKEEDGEEHEDEDGHIKLNH